MPLSHFQVRRRHLQCAKPFNIKMNWESCFKSINSSYMYVYVESRAALHPIGKTDNLVRPEQADTKSDKIHGYNRF